MNYKQVPTTMDNPTAVVVDTNAFPQGRLTLAAIRSLETLRDLGLHVIIPDVVCRELASHAWQDYLQAKDLLALSDVDTSGLDEAEKIYQLFTSKIQATGASVGASDYSSYRAAVHAQILRTAPASPKGDVTTGAADYMVFLQAREAILRYATVAVITSDKVLRSSLAGKPGIQVFSDFSSVRKGGVSHMRLPLQDALCPLRYLFSKAFEGSLAEVVLPDAPSSMSVVGIGDILRLNENDIIVYVDISAPIHHVTGAEYYGQNLERWQVTIDETTHAIVSWGQISSDSLAVWPPDFTPLVEYLSTELSMIPSVIRPVPVEDFINENMTPTTYSDHTNSNVEFFMGEIQLGSVQHSSYVVVNDYEHEGVLLTDKREHTEIFLNGVASSRVPKGALARLITTKALELLP